MPSIPRLKADGVLTLDTLVRVIDEGVIKWWNDQQTVAKEKIDMFPFRADYVKDLSGTVEERETNNIITFRKIRLAPGSMGGNPFAGTKEHRPRHRETVTATDALSGKTTATVISGRWRDLLLRFDCFAPTWSEAAKLEERFEWLMNMFTGTIMKSGVNKMIFQGSYSDSYQMLTDYYYEPLTYYFRLEQLFLEDKEIAKEFVVNVSDTYRRILNKNDSKIK